TLSLHDALPIFVLSAKYRWTSLHLKAPTQVTCAHCQRSLAVQNFRPAPRDISSEGAAYLTSLFEAVNTLRRNFLLFEAVTAKAPTPGQVAVASKGREL